MSEVSPDLVRLEFPNPTSVKLDWTIDGDTPPTITIKDECSGQSLATVRGDIGGTYTLNLPANQQYRLFLQSNYADGPRNSNLLERYPGQPCTPAQPEAPEFPSLSAQPLPKTLNGSNQIVVTCVNANAFDHWIISVNGAQPPDQMSGSQTYRFASVPEQPFALSADGYFATTGYTGWSPPISVKGVANSNSVRDFLHNSGVDGTGGLLMFIRSSNSVSVRNMLGL